MPHDLPEQPTEPKVQQQTSPLKAAVRVAVAFGVIFPGGVVALLLFTDISVFGVNVVGGLSTLAGLGALCIADLMGYWRRKDDKTQVTEPCCYECREVQGAERAALLEREIVRKDNFTYFGHIAVMIGATLFLTAFLASGFGLEATNPADSESVVSGGAYNSSVPGVSGRMNERS